MFKTQTCSLRPRPLPSLNPYLAMIFCATPMPEELRVEEDESCSEGGGAMATPTEEFFFIIIVDSSISSSRFALPANPVVEVLNRNLFKKKRIQNINYEIIQKFQNQSNHILISKLVSMLLQIMFLFLHFSISVVHKIIKPTCLYF